LDGLLFESDRVKELVLSRDHLVAVFRPGVLSSARTSYENPFNRSEICSAPPNDWNVRVS
jgi:hypothetical protein